MGTFFNDDDMRKNNNDNTTNDNNNDDHNDVMVLAVINGTIFPFNTLDTSISSETGNRSSGRGVGGDKTDKKDALFT